MNFLSRQIPFLAGMVASFSTLLAVEPPTSISSVEELDPRSSLHIPIGLVDSVDHLKTFVEAEGGFSPGFATYGVYVWIRDQAGRLHAATQARSACTHGLADGGLLIPWSAWTAGDIAVRSELCQIAGAEGTSTGHSQLVCLRLALTNPTATARPLAVFIAIRPLGPAGGPIASLTSDGHDALLVDGHTALVADRVAQAIGVSDRDEVADLARAGKVPGQQSAASATGDCSGAMRFDVVVPAQGVLNLGAICPVLAGRRAVGHHWAPGGSNGNFKDTSDFIAASDGALQPDPGPVSLRAQNLNALFDQASAYWRKLVGQVELVVPDRRWGQGFAAMAGHIAMALNEGAPDVAVINYATYNRDGMYNTEVLHQSGMMGLAEKVIDHLYDHPFSGRVFPEADNPGQILWVSAQHWLYTRDRTWLARILPKATKLAQLIQYCRNTPTPHWVDMDGLDHGEAIPAARRKELKPGACDGHNPIYTDAYDIAGLRAAALLCAANDDPSAAATWTQEAERLMTDYQQRYGDQLCKGYGRYSVLWPCRLYPLDHGPAFEQFRGTGAQPYASWPYFGPATAHQGLLAGNRLAGFQTLENQFQHPQMQGWYAFDEGGKSGEGGWLTPGLRSRWTKSSAMPHGWAIAEVTLLLRDSLVFAERDQLVLFSGISPAWFRGPDQIHIANLPTHHGLLGLDYLPNPEGAVLSFTGGAKPPGGFRLRLPDGLKASIAINGQPASTAFAGDIHLPANTLAATIRWLP